MDDFKLEPFDNPDVEEKLDYLSENEISCQTEE